MDRVILVLEDDEISISVIRRVLAVGGYECVVARNESEALEHCAHYGRAVEAMIADLLLPDCRGTDVAQKLTALRPGLPVLFVSGTPLEAWPERDRWIMLELPSWSRFIGKPLRAKMLLEKLAELVDA